MEALLTPLPPPYFRSVACSVASLRGSFMKRKRVVVSGLGGKARGENCSTSGEC